MRKRIKAETFFANFLSPEQIAEANVEYDKAQILGQCLTALDSTGTPLCAIRMVMHDRMEKVDKIIDCEPDDLTLDDVMTFIHACGYRTKLSISKMDGHYAKVKRYCGK